jgi:protein-S-isoprenylcysteine O-methyltransferase Ste14
MVKEVDEKITQEKRNKFKKFGEWLILAVILGTIIGFLFLMNSILQANPIPEDAEIPVILLLAYTLASIIAGERITVVALSIALSSAYLILTILKAIALLVWLKLTNKKQIQISTEVKNENDSSL